MRFSPPLQVLERGPGGEVSESPTIEDIVAMYVINESPIDWITEEFGLTYAQIYAALSYYYDHKEAVDRAMDETEALASKIGLNSQAHLVQIRARQSNS